jgi:DNA replication protein DnaC
VRLNVPHDHPDFGRAVPCRCTEEQNAEERTARLARYSQIGPLSRLTFRNLIDRGRSAAVRDQELYKRCVADARAFAEAPEGWIVLSGASGCGKTHIAAAIVNRLLERGEPALFVVVPDLLDHLRAAYQPGAEIGYDELFERVRNAPVLVLDDLGTQAPTPWAQEKLFQLVNHRFNTRLPTVITTNLHVEQIDERLRTRLTDTGVARVYTLEPRRPSDMRAHGTGKTHLAAAIANYRRARGEAPCFVVVPDLLDYLRRGFAGGDERDSFDAFDEMKHAPLLILDDLDTQTGIPWVRDRLFQLLNFRHTARLPTVITTALSLDDLGERLASRLVDHAVCTVIVLGDAPRTEAAPRRRRGRSRN